MQVGSLSLAALRCLAAALALRAAPAHAHATLHEVVRARAIAIRAYEGDGSAVADAAWEVYSPSDPRTPWQRGRTDRRGWLAFVPDAPGSWRVRVIEKTGHGLDTRIDVEPAPAPVQVAATKVDESGWAVAVLIRPVLGVAVVVALFAALFLFYRRRGER